VSKKNAHTSKYRDDNQRTLIAQEAARIIHEHGLADFRAAKSKAADNLGLGHQGSLPSNHEIAEAVAEHRRIFHEDQHSQLLKLQRQIAVYLMQRLGTFRPRLVGAVLSGNITEHSPIELHVYSDTSEAVGMMLDAQGVVYQSGVRKHSIQKGKPEEFPYYHFSEEYCLIRATVFSERRQQHAPLCPINGRPMQRAGLRDVELLLADAEISTVAGDAY
jgi:hypothetical protein